MSKLRRSSVIHILFLYAISRLLQLVWDYNLEFLIVILIAYEVGYWIPLADELLKANVKFVDFLRKKFDKKPKGKARRVPTTTD